MPRYLLPNRTPATQPLTYVPYWRFKGMVFTCRPSGIGHRFLDLSRCALDAGKFPASLGLRPQAMHLKPVTPGLAGRFLTPTLAQRRMLDRLDSITSPADENEVFLESQIGESLSLIYMPVYQKRRLYDAVLDRPLSGSGQDLDLDALDGGPAQGSLRFVPAICPQCGWNLEGRRDSLTLVCRNCDRVWQARRRGLEQIRIAHVPDSGNGSIYLPFWRIKADVEGLALASRADMVRLANLPQVPRPEWQNEPFRFWFPAFKVRPATLLRLASGLTLRQPRTALVDRLPSRDLFAVNLPLSEAVEGLKMLLAAFAKPPRQIYPRLARLRITPQAMLLVYIPFSTSVHEYLQPDLKLAINRNQLLLAGNL